MCKDKEDLTAWTLTLDEVAGIAGVAHIHELEKLLAETKNAARGATTSAKACDAMKYVEKIQSLQLQLETARIKNTNKEGKPETPRW